MLLKTQLRGVENMEILKRLLELISDFLQTYEKRKIEKEEIKKVEVKQKEKTQENLKTRKKEDIKPPKKDDFFNDNSW